MGCSIGGGAVGSILSLFFSPQESSQNASAMKWREKTRLDPNMVQIMCETGAF